MKEPLTPATSESFAIRPRLGQIAALMSPIYALIADMRLRIALMIVLGTCAALAEALTVALVLYIVYRLIAGAAGNGNGTVISAINSSAPALHFSGTAILTILTAALVLARSALATAYGLLADWIAGVAADRVRVRIFDRLMRMPFGDINRHRHGTLINTIGTESRAVSDVIIRLSKIASNALAIAVYLIGVCFVSSVLAAFVLGFGVLLFVLGIAWSRVVGIVNAEITATNRDLFVLMYRGVQAFRTVRVFAVEEAFIAEFVQASSKVVRSVFRLAKLNYTTRPLRDIGFLVMLALFLWASNGLGVAATGAIAVVTLLYRILPHATEIEDELLAAFAARLPLRRAVDLMAAPVSSRTGPLGFASLRDSIVFDRVGFSYPNAPLASLHNVSFAIARGETFVLKGVNGSGKTTLVNLLAKLYEPSSGTILVDGEPLEDIDRQDWLRRTGFAGQNGDLIDDTIAGNVRFGREGISLDDIRHALSVTGMMAMIDALPDGLDTKVGGGQFRLSGGEQQRVLLARALVAKPCLLVLDEATSAIDVQSEADILRAIRSYLPASTFLIVTHRAGSTTHEHEAVLENGSIVRTRQSRAADIARV
jgi:ABC-type multidrug transport system fused ATPase/permease subunit